MSRGTFSFFSEQLQCPTHTHTVQYISSPHLCLSVCLCHKNRLSVRSLGKHSHPSLPLLFSLLLPRPKKEDSSATMKEAFIYGAYVQYTYTVVSPVYLRTTVLQYVMAHTVDICAMICVCRHRYYRRHHFAICPLLSREEEGGKEGDLLILAHQLIDNKIHTELISAIPDIVPNGYYAPTQYMPIC